LIITPGGNYLATRADSPTMYRSVDGVHWTTVFSNFDVAASAYPPVAAALDTNGADDLKDFITHTRYGLGRPVAEIDTVSFGATEGVVTAEGLLCSPILDHADSGLRHIEE